MVVIGGQTIVGRPAPGTEPLENPVAHQQIQDTINCHTIDRTAAVQRFEYVSGRQRKAVVSDDFQHADSIGGRLEARRTQ